MRPIILERVEIIFSIICFVFIQCAFSLVVRFGQFEMYENCEMRRGFELTQMVALF